MDEKYFSNWGSMSQDGRPVFPKTHHRSKRKSPPGRKKLPEFRVYLADGTELAAAFIWPGHLAEKQNVEFQCSNPDNTKKSRKPSRDSDRLSDWFSKRLGGPTSIAGNRDPMTKNKIIRFGFNRVITLKILKTFGR